MNKILLILFSTLIGNVCVGQSTLSDKLDSMSTMRETVSAQLEASLELEIGKVLLRLNVDSAKAIFRNIHQKAVKSDSLEMAASAISYYAVALMYQSKNDSSAHFFEIAKGLLNSEASYDLRTTIINNETINFYYQGKYDQVVKNFSELATLAKLENVPLDIAMAQNNLGLTFLNLGRYHDAMESFLIAERHYDSLRVKDQLAAVYNNIALIYKQIGDLSMALAYSRKEIAIDMKIGDLNGLSGGYTMLGIIFAEMEAADSALFYYQKSLEISRQIHHVDNTFGSLLSMAIHFRNQANTDSARYYFDQCLTLSQSEEIDAEKLARTYLNYGVLLIEVKTYRQAMNYLEKGKKIADQIQNTLLITFAHEALSQYYEHTNDYKRAFEHMKKFMISNDSMVNISNLKTINELEIKYDSEKKLKEIEVLSLENQLKGSEIATANGRFYALSGAILLILIVVFLVFNRYKHKQRALLAEEKALNQKQGFKSLIEGEEKERKRIAQELHDGLGQLLSSARLNVSAMEDNFKDIVTVQWNNSLKLIDDAVTEVRHISHNMMPNALVSIGFEAALKEQVHIINDAGAVKVHAQFPNEKIKIDEAEAIGIYRVIQELLNNALKYAKAENIWLEVSAHEGLHVSVADDGCGFDTTQISKSKGIGWRNISSRVEILNGQMDLQSEKGKGSKISITFNSLKVAV